MTYKLKFKCKWCSDGCELIAYVKNKHWIPGYCINTGGEVRWNIVEILEVH